MATDRTDRGAEGENTNGSATAVGDTDSESESVPHPAFAAYADESVPGATVGAPGKDGRLELRFGVDRDGDTNLVRDLARAPFHVSGTLGHDPHPRGETVYVQSPSEGVAQGDRRSVTVEVGAEAVAHVSTQSSTKVLSMGHNYAESDIALSVGADAHLDYVPAPTILHGDARYHEALTVELAPSATAVVGEVVVPGRLARGERFEFERYLSEFQARSDGDLLAADATHLAPGESDPTAPGVLGEFTVLGTLYVLAPGGERGELSDRLHAVVADEERAGAADDADHGGADDERRNDDTVRAGATALPNDAGVAVRALGHRAETVTGTVHDAWDEARTALLGVGAPDPRRL